MYKDRIEGAAKQAKGAIKEAVGKVAADATLQVEDEADEAEGRWRKAVGSLSETHHRACAG